MIFMFGLCAAIGAVLGLRFKVVALVPLIFLAIFGAVVVGAAAGWKLWSIIGTAIVGVVAVQIGYLLGAVARAMISSISARSCAQIEIEGLSQPQ